MRGRRYWVTATLGNRGRRKLQVFDPAAQDLRVIHVLPDSAHTKQQLAVLRRINRLQGFTQILDVDRRGDSTWVLTEWVHGEPLSNHLNQARRQRNYWPSAHMSWTLFAGFAHSLSQLHQFANCVHGDIKPANLILQFQPKRLRAIDYGSAWDESAAKRRLSGDGNTVGYAAPEFKANESVTVQADQFSLSVVLYEMLAGELPFQGMGGRAGWLEYKTDFESSYQAPSEKSHQRQQLPRRAWRLIDGVLSTGLSLKPEGRFETSNAWRDAIDEVTQVLRQAESASRWQSTIADVADQFVVYFERRDRRS
jgi:serine/threonine-protein kinase